MKAIIEVEFKKILGKKVDKKMLEENPALQESTNKTITILCEQIKRYFLEHKIKTNVHFKLENV
jgi:hypothetical protein